MASPDNLSTRLQEMLRLNNTDYTTRSAAPSTKKPLIEIVNHSPSSDDDDEPPPLDYFKSIRQADPNNAAQQQEQLSLAEQMMRDADRAALQKKKIVDSKRHSNASKVSKAICFVRVDYQLFNDTTLTFSFRSLSFLNRFIFWPASLSNLAQATFGVKKGFLNNNVRSSSSKSANKKKSIDKVKSKQTKPSVGATQSDVSIHC